MLKSAGRFFIYTMRYNKQYSAPEELVTILRERGLIIEEEEVALQNIRSIGYYRLSAYLHPFLRIPKTEHVFKEGASFEQAMSIYTFDRHLRLLIFDQIERIEIAVRSAIVNITSRDKRFFTSAAVAPPRFTAKPACFVEIAAFPT